MKLFHFVAQRRRLYHHATVKNKNTRDYETVAYNRSGWAWWLANACLHSLITDNTKKI